MNPTIIASCDSLPTERVLSALGRPGGIETPTLVAARTALPPKGMIFALGRPGGKTH